MTAAPSIKEALELKPCPFCSKQPQSRWHGATGEDDDSGYWGIDCCQAFSHGGSQEDAVEKWNTRATLSPSAGELSGISGELRDSVAEAIRGDGSDLCDAPWNTLSDENKIGWRGDADRAIAAFKENLKVSNSPPAGERREAIARLKRLRNVMHASRSNNIPMQVWDDDLRSVDAALSALASGLAQDEPGWQHTALDRLDKLTKAAHAQSEEEK